MFLAVDVGNTNTLIGVDAGNGAWDHQWRFSTIRSSLAADWAPAIATLSDRDHVALDQISGVCISSVVPVSTLGLIAFFREWRRVEPLIVASHLNLNLPLTMDRPPEVGTDRIANAVGARALTDHPVIVVDLGTATKVEAISAEHGFMGGAIAIGLGVSVETLAARAARLFSMELVVPEQSIGRNTTEALQSGIVLGHRYMIEGLIADFRARIGANAGVILTGGHVHDVGPGFLPESRFEPDLTLNGIREIHRLNPI